jgi:hypothetical protein
LSEVPEAQEEFNSYITLLPCEDPTQQAGIILVLFLCGSCGSLWNILFSF